MLTIDGRCSQHLLLVRGEAAADCRVMLGRHPRGRHALAIATDEAGSAPRLGRAIVESVTVMPIGGGPRRLVMDAAARLRLTATVASAGVTV